MGSVINDTLQYPFMYVLAVALALTAGAAIAYWLHKRAQRPQDRWRRLVEPRRITVGEFIAGALIMTTVVAPGMNTAMTKVAISHAVGGFHELLRGSVLHTGKDTVPCEEDGFCSPTRQCDPYPVQMLDHYDTVPDGVDTKGNPKTKQVPVYRTEIRYHDCPYVKYVMDYWVITSLGDKIYIAQHVLPPTLERWDPHFAIPSNVQAHAPPAKWQQDRDGELSGHPAPIAKDHTYVNYLLAAQAACPHDYSDQFAKFQSLGVLVDHTENVNHPVNDDNDANEVVFAKKSPPNKAAFETALSRQNAELGMEKQGDMHVVVVPDSVVGIGEADNYAGTLCSWWQNPARGKYGLAKNTIMVVVGVSDDFTTIKWSRAFTGIPLGNGAMISALTNDLTAFKVPFTPEALFGNPTATISGGDITYHHGNGAVEHIVLDEHPFNRPCMITCVAGQQGGFQYVSASIMLTATDKVWLQMATFGVALLLWGIFVLVGFRKEMFIQAGVVTIRFVRNASRGAIQRLRHRGES